MTKYTRRAYQAAKTVLTQRNEQKTTPEGLKALAEATCEAITREGKWWGVTLMENDIHPATLQNALQTFLDTGKDPEGCE